MKMKFLSVAAMLAFATMCLDAQVYNKVESLQDVPVGVVTYALPSTTIHLTVETVREDFTPGVYAKFAKKYLGIEVAQEAAVTHKLRNIKMVPYIEADRENNYVLDLSGMAAGAAPLSFLQFTSQGLVILSDAHKGNAAYMRFPSMTDAADRINAAVTDNLTSAETTLYQNVKNDKGTYDRVAFKQSQVVEKSAEKKAQEAAGLILSLREQRINIITGDTDATFSGDALRAAIEEINRLEEEYMSLFTGVTVSTVTKMDFDVTPEACAEEDMSIAFRLSDANGLVDASDVSGRPIVIRITPEEDTDVVPEPVVTEKQDKKSRFKGAPSELGSIFYRVPSICSVKIIDGQSVLLQGRMPVYQKGHTLTFPVDVLVR